MKTCNICKKEKSDRDFYKRHGGGLKWCCKECEKERDKVRNSEKKEERSRINKIYREKHKERLKFRRFLVKYNLTPEDYILLEKESKGRCSICLRPTERLVVDHNHSTGTVRELLCNNCNLGIGYFKENLDYLHRAIYYIQKFDERENLMSGINKVLQIGRLTRDPELRYTKDGKGITNFSLAIDESYKNAEGEWQQKAIFTDWQIWNGQGETLCRLTTKGDLIFVEGKYGLDEWTDSEGNKRSRPKFTASNWKLLAKKGGVKVPTEDVEETEEAAPPPKAKKEKVEKKATQKAPQVDEDDDDAEVIPF